MIHSERTDRTLRIGGRDRTWRGAHTIILLDRIDAPTVTGLRQTLRMLASAAPGHRLFRTIDPDQLRWRQVAPGELTEHCDRMVAAFHPEPGEDPDAMVKRLYEHDCGDLPIAFFLSPTTAAVWVRHPLIDGRTVMDIFPELLRRAADGQPPADLVRSSLRHPLLTALRSYYGSQPRRVLTTLRSPRLPYPAPPAGRAERPWSPDVTTVSMRGDEDLLARMRVWRKKNASGVSGPLIFFAAARAALDAAGLVPDAAGMFVLIDNRRYLPRNARVDGNFSVGLYLEPSDATSPAQIAQAMSDLTDSGRPLATMSLITLRNLRARPLTVPTRIAEPATPVPTLNHMGRMRSFEKLPWLDGGADGRLLSVTTPGLPEGITFMMTELLGRVHVSAGFHATAFDPADVRKAVEALCTDPTGLLTPSAITA